MCLQPTVGEACQKYHQLPLRTRGLYLTLHDRGNILKKLQAWPQQDIKVAVVTDGERILGLGETADDTPGVWFGSTGCDLGYELFHVCTSDSTCTPVIMGVLLALSCVAATSSGWVPRTSGAHACRQPLPPCL